MFCSATSKHIRQSCNIPLSPPSSHRNSSEATLKRSSSTSLNTRSRGGDRVGGTVTGQLSSSGSGIAGADQLTSCSTTTPAEKSSPQDSIRLKREIRSDSAAATAIPYFESTSKVLTGQMLNEWGVRGRRTTPTSVVTGVIHATKFGKNTSEPLIASKEDDEAHSSGSAHPIINSPASGTCGQVEQTSTRYCRTAEHSKLQDKSAFGTSSKTSFKIVVRNH